MPPRITAHRGCTRRFPPDTMGAFHDAVTCGARRVEFDVHATRDGVLVVHHDYGLDDPDNGSGLIFERTFDELQGLEIRTRDGGIERIPRMMDLFDAFGPSIDYEIELRGFDEVFLRNVLREVDARGLHAHVELTCPLPLLLRKVHDLDDRIATGMFFGARPGWMAPELGRRLVMANMREGGFAVAHGPVSMFDPELVDALHRAGRRAHAANCNSQDDLVRAFELDVDQLSTDMLEHAVSFQRTQ